MHSLQNESGMNFKKNIYKKSSNSADDQKTTIFLIPTLFYEN